MQATYIVICSCDKMPDLNPENLKEIREKLKDQGYRVYEYSRLCHSPKVFKELKRKCDRIVIGACSNYRDALLQMVNDGGFKLFKTRIVPIYDFALLSGDQGKALTMLLEYSDALSVAPEPPDSSVKLDLPIIGRKMSRRRLLTSILKPSEVSTPWVLGSCNGCGVCVNICREKAISLDGGRAIIDSLKCTACDCCVGSCPSSSIESVRSGLRIIHARLKRVALSGYKSILFYCSKMRDEVLAWSRGKTHGTADIYPFELPCLTALSPQIIFSLIYSGFRSLYFVECADDCSKAAVNLVKGYVKDASKLAVWDHREISITHGSVENTKPLYNGRGWSFNVEFKPLKEIFSRNVSNSGVILFEATPVGFLKISDNCTACGACADACPTGSLEVRREEAYRVVFRHETCVACGKCVGVCPEKAVSMVRGLDTRLLGRDAVLFEVEIARCRGCGRVLGPDTMLRRVSEKLRESGLEDSHVYLCPECRAKALLDLAG